MAIDWPAVETALQNWIEVASGLDDRHVIWAQQAGQRLEPPFFVLEVRALRVVGVDWLEVRDAAAPEPGAEIEFVVRGARQMVLGVSCFAGDAVGALSSMALLGSVLTAARLPSTQAALSAAGVGVGSFGPVQSLAVQIGTDIEPRAVGEVTLHLAEERVEAGTYVEHVEIVDEGSGAATVVPPMAPP